MLVAPAGSQAEFPLWPPLLASRGLGGRSARHAHHALHVMLAIDGELRVRGLGEWARAAGVVTAPDAVHEIDATGTEVLLVFLDPESAAGARLKVLVEGVGPESEVAEPSAAAGRGSAAGRSDASSRRGVARLRASGEASAPRPVRRTKARERAFRLISAGERDQLVDLTPLQLMRKDGVEWARRAAAVLGGIQPTAADAAAQAAERDAPGGSGVAGSARTAEGADTAQVAGTIGGNVHPRVRRALRHLQTLDPSQDQSLAALAKVAGLSEGRFMHAFTDSVGIPLRPYLAWLKLQRAAAAIVRGSTLAEAAYGAGFADAAHMTRAFKRMFGIRPSELRK
jgi:AraC-like DNA-binding protein